jgi:hypothetical protein
LAAGASAADLGRGRNIASILRNARFECGRLLSAQDTFHVEGTVNRQLTHLVNCIFSLTYTESRRDVPGTAIACNLGEFKELQ